MKQQNNSSLWKNRLLFISALFGMFFIAIGWAISSQPVEAKPPTLPGYETAMNTQYPNLSANLKNCVACHINGVPSKSTVNPYGAAYAAAGYNFTAIESTDSDGDNFSNIAEITAGTNPGDAASKPAVVSLTSVTISGATTGDTGASQVYTTTFAPTNATTPISYSWSQTPTSGQNTDTASYTWNTAGTYAVTVTATNSAGSVVGTHSITITDVVVPLTGVTISGATTGDTGASQTYTTTIAPLNATTPISYTWSPTPTSGQSTGTANYTWNTAGTYAVTVTATNSAGSVVGTHSITITDVVVPLTGVTINGATTGDTGASQVYTATIAPLNATTPISYSWSPTPTSGQSTGTANYTWNTAGTYTVTVTATNSAGSVVGTHSITITDVPLTGVTISGTMAGQPSITYTYNAVITPLNATTPITYTWTPTPTTQGTASADYNWTITGTHTITVVAKSATGAVTDTKLVTIRIVPLDSVAISGIITGYQNIPYTFSAITTPITASIPITYSWSPTPTSGQGTADATYSWAVTGTQSISVTATNPAGQVVSSTHSLTIAVFIPLSSVAISGITVGHINMPYTFNATTAPITASTPISYSWSPTPISGQGTADATYNWAVTGTQSISVIASNGAGQVIVSNTHSINISVPLDSVAISGAVTGYQNTSYTFNATTAPITATTPISYSWSPTPTSGQGTATATYDSWAVGTQSITVTASNIAGVVVSNTHLITIYNPVSTGTFDSVGGSLTSDDGNVNVIIPSGAVSNSTTFTYTRQVLTDSLVLGDGVVLMASDANGDVLTFTTPITIVIKHGDLGNIDPASRLIYWSSGTTWLTSGVTTTNLGTNVVTGTTTHFTTFAVRGTATVTATFNSYYLPVVMRWFDPFATK